VATHSPAAVEPTAESDRSSEMPMMLTYRGFAIASTLLLTIVAPTFVDAEDPPTAPIDYDSELAHDDLRILVKPLTKDELVIVADTWFGQLRIRQAAITRARIDLKKKGPLDAAGGNAGEESAPPRDLKALQAGRTGVIEGLDIILDELELKGGDATDYRTYINAISGFEIDVVDAGAVWTVVSDWFGREDGGKKWGKNIASFVGLVVLFWFLSRLVARLLKKALDRTKRLSTLLRRFFVRTTTRLVFFIGLIIAVSQLGVDIGPLLAVIGAAGFVVAFALQGTLSNLASGLLILLYRPFDIGDSVEVAGVSGTVMQLSLVATRINTWDNKVLFVPNNSIWNGIITNITGSETRRIDMVFGIGYPDDIGKAIEVLQDVVKSHELVLDTPEPTIRVRELADSSVNLDCRPWVNGGDYGSVKADLHRSVKERFDAEGISIPYPQQDVHLSRES
jgi:small conductance mechanosensitive channel